MNIIVQKIQKAQWIHFIVMCLTLGLAPFAPPHIVEKLQMLFQGTLVRPIDWFDLFLHGTPWLLLFFKIFIHVKARKASQS